MLKYLAAMLVILTVLSMVSSIAVIACASRVYPSLIVPSPELYNMISGKRVLLKYRSIHEAIVKGVNYNVTKDGYVVLGVDSINGYIQLSYPQPSPMIILYFGNETINEPRKQVPSSKLTILVEFSKGLMKWYLSIYHNESNYNIIRINGTDIVGGKVFIYRPIIMKESLERIEIGYMSGIIYFYVKSARIAEILYYPIENNYFVSKISMWGQGKVKGEIYSIEPLASGPKIIIAGLEQKLIDKETYYITKSKSIYFAITPSSVEIELLKPIFKPDIRYRKSLTSVINTKYAFGSLEVLLEPSINGTNITLTTHFSYLINLTNIISNVYKLDKIMLRFDVYSYIEKPNDTIEKYYMGSYILELSKTARKLTIKDIPYTMRNLSIEVYMLVPGIYYGESPLSIHEEKILTIDLNDLVTKVSVPIVKTFVRGYLTVARKHTIVRGEYMVEIQVITTHLVNLIDLLEKLYPQLIHQYILLEVNVDNQVYSTKKAIESNKAIVTLHVPLGSRYDISVYLIVPGIVTGQGSIDSTVKELIAHYTVNVITLEPKIVIDLPPKITLRAEWNQSYVKLNIPVRVYWVHDFKVILATPTVYNVYVYDQVDDKFELIYSTTLPWLSDAELEVELPIADNVTEGNMSTLLLLVEVKSYIGDRWTETMKRIIITITRYKPTPPPINTTLPPTPILPTPNMTTPTFKETITVVKTKTETITTTVYLVNVSVTTLKTTITETITQVKTLTKVSMRITTTTVKVPTTLIRTKTIVPELPQIIATPPYSIGIGVLALLVSLLLSLIYIRALLRRRSRR